MKKPQGFYGIAFMGKDGLFKLCTGANGPIGVATFEKGKKELEYWQDGGPEGVRLVYVEVAPGGEAFKLSKGCTEA